jgi:MYXO-CTERM domain-containing protein
MCYRVVPHDGVAKRLNLITQKVHVELDRDRYQAAMLGTERDYVSLDILNQTGDAHVTKVTMQGLAAGMYPVMIDGAGMGSVTVTEGQAATWMMQLGPEPQHTLQIGTRCQGVMPVTMPPGAAGAGATPPATGVGVVAGSGGASAHPATGAAGNKAGAPAIAAASSAAAGSGANAPPSTATGDAAPAAANGCGCRVARGRERAPVGLIALGLLAALRRRRRRSRHLN